MVNLTLLPYSPRLLLTSCSWFVLPGIPLDHHPQHGHASELLLLRERHRLRGELSFYGHPPYHNRQECASSSSSSSSPTRRVFTKKLNSTQCVSLSLVLILWACRRLLLNTIIIILSTFRGNIITIFLAKF